MTNRAIFMLLSLIISLAACNQLPKKSAQTPPKETSQVERWILPDHVKLWLDQEEYGLVLEWLKTIPRDKPGFEKVGELHNEVKKLAKDYEKKVLDEVNVKLAKKDMDGVLVTLRQGLRKLPNNRRFIKRRNQLFTKQFEQIRKLNYQLLIARGQYLLKEVKIREELAQLDWDNASAQWSLNRINEELRIVSLELIDCSKKELRRGNLELSTQCIQLAGRLHPSPDYQKTARKLQQLLRKHNKPGLASIQKPTLPEKGRPLTARELDGLVKRALTEGRLREALQIIKARKKLGKNEKQINDLEKAIENKLVSTITKLMKRGNKYYRNGSIKSAKRDWEQVLQLDPENVEAKKNVERAQRVLDKLNKLKEEESG